MTSPRDGLVADPDGVMDVVERLKPLAAALKRCGWDVNLAIEYREGECFTFSGKLPLKVEVAGE